MYTNRSTTTTSIASSTTMSADEGGVIEKVLILNGDATSALAALLYDLDAALAAPGVCVAANQREALFDLRKAAFGY
jgi:hypothetical protein